MVTSELQIERAIPDDVPHIAPLFDRYRQFYGQPSDVSGAVAFLQANVGSRQSVIYFAYDEQRSRIAGFTQLYPTFSSISMQNSWILNDLFVDPEYRSQGAGRALLEAARRHAIETGAKGLELAAAADNHTAQRLYEAAGYERDDEFVHYFLKV
ncbi:GNAT family N-acetyltransferase [Paenibacillus cremeus]|uniref:GNAT family N-acetyltransferase n=1 Tax=Paenibacillus cremeus TaxID=2163881 RepID=A0A559KA03_9BACL|nr:GNAT family N-acetyltransferase [Paenibacillus cremeus]TVY08946.1 GNAT family N-acetyltransferase [Paenibacillus cremeus]